MNEQYSTSYFVEKTDRDANSPVVNPDPSAGEVPVDAAPVQETPMGGTDAVVVPMDEPIVHEAPMGEPITHEAPIGTNAGSSAALLNREESEHYRTRWNEIQGKFVDEPALCRPAGG